MPASRHYNIHRPVYQGNWEVVGPKVGRLVVLESLASCYYLPMPSSIIKIPKLAHAQPGSFPLFSDPERKTIFDFYWSH
jgi:hypothetical protein